MYLKCGSFCLSYKVTIVIVGQIVWFPFGYGNGYQTFLFSISSYVGQNNSGNISSGDFYN